jgi:LEA14-like dessication related protein
VWVEADTALGVSQHRLEPSGRAPLAETFGAAVDGVFAEDSARVVEVGLPRLEGTEVALRVDLEFPGHLPFPIQVRRARYKVWLADTYMGEGESTEGFRVTPGSGGRGRFALRIPAERVPGLAGRLLVGQPEARIEGEVEIDPIGPLRSVPFRARRLVR